MHMAKLFGSSGILARTREVVKVKAHFLYCFKAKIFFSGLRPMFDQK